MNIDIASLLTVDHQKIIQDKITQALNLISIEDIKVQILNNMDFSNIGEYITDDLDYEPFTNHFNSLIKEQVKLLKK